MAHVTAQSVQDIHRHGPGKTFRMQHQVPAIPMGSSIRNFLDARSMKDFHSYMVYVIVAVGIWRNGVCNDGLNPDYAVAVWDLGERRTNAKIAA